MTESDQGRTAGTRAFRALTVGVAALLSVGCDNSKSPTDPHVSPDKPSQIVQYCADPTQPDCAPPPPNPADTHVSADVTYSTTYTVTLADYFTDPVSGQYTNTMTVSPADLHVHAEAGYTATGAVKVTTTYSDGTDPSTSIMPQIVNQDLTGDSLTDVNAYGYALLTSTPDSMAAAPAMNLVGTTANGDITAGILVSAADTFVASASVAPSAGSYRADRIRTAGIRSGSEQRLSPAAAFARASSGEIVSASLRGMPVRIKPVGVDMIMVEDDRTVIDAAATNTSANDLGTEKHTRKYKKSRDGWLITEDRSETSVDDARGHREHVSVATFTNIDIHRNLQRDAQRRLLRPTTAWMPRKSPGAAAPAGSAAPVSLSTSERTWAPSNFRAGGPATPNVRFMVPQGPVRMIACTDDCANGTAPNPSGPPPTGYDPPCIGDVASTVNSPGGSVNVLYQHGFASSALTWCRMSQYVRERYAVGNEIRHSLDWKASYEDQAADLANRFRSDASTYRGPYVLVGHSNGGLVNRYMAQQLQDPSLVRGVITVSSPHAGAYLANTTQRVLMGILAVPISGYYMGCDMADAYVCTRGGNLATQVALALAPVLASSAFPVLQEMGTNAPFHGTINQRGDVGYIAAGVQNRIWDRWTMWRVLSDFQRCPDGYFDCDQYSRNYVNAVDKNYHHFIDCAVISGFLGIFWPPSRSTAAGCAKNAAFLRVTDVAYKRLSVGSGHGDGVVPEFSQMYPGAPATMQFLVDDTDSHLGETRSRISAGGVLRALNQGLRIPFDQ